MVSNFLAVVVRRILYYCFRSREGCCLESTLFENDPMSYMTWVLKNTHTALSYFGMDLKQCGISLVLCTSQNSKIGQFNT